MSKDRTFRSTRYLPQVALATITVAVLPVVVVWVLLAKGVVSSPWLCVALAIALSLLASLLGSAYWKRRSGPGDVLFSELMLWGWLLRLQAERHLANAVGVLGLSSDGLPETEESIERRSQVLTQMAAAIDAQDPYTHGHSRRVALHAAMIARRMGLSRDEVASVRTAAAVHDVGKLRVPLELINKNEALTPAEFELVKSHADEGAEIVSCMQDPQITEAVRHHHERFDGTGYPAGLAGEQIPRGARIIAVADTFDALTSERPYRAAVPHKKALDIILAVSGTQLDPVAVRAFLKCYSGKRAVFFWTLLTVSPQRALAFLGGRKLGPVSLGSVPTVAIPAALSALVAVAVAPAGTGVAASSPLRLADRPSAQLAGLSPVGPSSARPQPSTARATPVHRSPGAAGDPSSPRTALLGITTTRSRNSGGPTFVSTSPVSSGPSQTGSSGGSRHHAGGSRSGFGTISVRAPAVGGSTKPTSGSTGPNPPTRAGGSGGPSPPPAGNPSSGGSGASNPANGGAGGGSGGSGHGNGGGGNGGGNGGNGGNGGGNGGNGGNGGGGNGGNGHGNGGGGNGGGNGHGNGGGGNGRGNGGGNGGNGGNGGGGNGGCGGGGGSGSGGGGGRGSGGGGGWGGGGWGGGGGGH